MTNDTGVASAGTGPSQLEDHLIDAMTRTANLLGGDSEYARSCAFAYRGNRSELVQLIHPGEQPEYVFTAMILDRGKPQLGIGVLLPDRLVLSWEFGFSKHGVAVLPFHSLQSIGYEAASSERGFGGNPVLRLQGNQPWQILVPPAGTQVAETIAGRISALTAAPNESIEEASGTDADGAAVQDPAADPAVLGQVAGRRPDLHTVIARHPRVYRELLDWIARYGDPAARTIAAARLDEA